MLKTNQLVGADLTHLKNVRNNSKIHTYASKQKSVFNLQLPCSFFTPPKNDTPFCAAARALFHLSPLQVAKPISGLLPGLNVTVRGPSAGGRVAERSAALMREFKDGKEDYGGGGNRPGGPGGRGGKKTPSRARGRRAGKGHEEPGTPQSQLTALKSMLGKPHVYGVADRAFK